MFKKMFLAAVILGCSVAVAHAQMAPPSSDSAQMHLEQLLKAPDADNITKAFALLDQSFARDPKAAEDLLRSLARYHAVLMADAAHTPEMLRIIDLAKQAKIKGQGKAKIAAGNYGGIGYIYAMEVVTLTKAGRAADAMASFKEGLSREPGKNFAGELMGYWPGVFKDANAAPPANSATLGDARASAPIGDAAHREAYLTFLQAIAAGCRDQDVIEYALKRRIDIFNATSRPAEALADAKSLFNVTTIAHTAVAIQILDQQLALASTGKQEQFRSEQIQGAQPLSEGMSARTSAVVQSLAADAAAFEAAGSLPADDTLAARLQQARVLLMAGKPADALIAIQRAAADTTDPKGAENLIEMAARCYRAQDGTVARANALLAGSPKLADVRGFGR